MNRLHDFYALFGNTRVHEHEPETFADWIAMEFNQTLDEYKKNLFRRWGGTLDLLALARIFQRDIHVYVNHKRIVIQKPACCSSEKPVLIVYNGINH